MSVKNVSVNLNVTVDATGNVSVFSQPASTLQDTIVAAVPLAAATLYKGADDSLIKFQDGPSVEEISATLNTTYTTSTLGANKTALNGALNLIVNGSFNCATALPFSGYSGSTYHTRSSFGQVALGKYAHDLFGHVAATAAIDNDTTFVAAMNGNLDGQTPAHAKIATLLANAIFALDDAKCTAIAKQVIGQDSSRAGVAGAGEDNDRATPGDYQALQFKSGDVIYVQVQLLAPTVTVTSGQQSTPVSTAARTYALKITLN